MGLIGKIIISFTRGSVGLAKKADVVVDPGSGANITGANFSSAGDDAQPALTDIPILMPINGGKQFAVIGYVDPLNEGKTLFGEKRIYGRNVAGLPVSSVWCKGDGTVLINDLVTVDILGNIVSPTSIGAATIAAVGAITAASIAAVGAITAASVAATGAITAATVVAAGIGLTTHVHSVDGNPGVTGAPQ